MEEQSVIYDIINGLPVPVIIVNSNSKVQYINNKTKEYLELEAEDPQNIHLGMVLNCNNLIDLSACSTSVCR